MKADKNKMVLIISKDKDGRYSYKMDRYNGGSYMGGGPEVYKEWLKPECLNDEIRHEYRDNDVYPKIHINDCGRISVYEIPEEKKWHNIETPMKFKPGEIIAIHEYDYESDDEIDKKGFIRHKEYNQYYIEFFKVNKGYEYMGFPEQWAEEDEIIKLEGKIIDEVYLRGHFPDIEDENWCGFKSTEIKDTFKISDIVSIEKIDKYCRTEKKDGYNGDGKPEQYINDKCAAGKCNCIIAQNLLTFKDGSRLCVHYYDADLINAITGIVIVDNSTKTAAEEKHGQLDLFS